MRVTHILWIAPNFNHYKAKFLEYLNSDEFELTVLAGSEISLDGHRSPKSQWSYEVVNVPVQKSKFQFHFRVYKALYSLAKSRKFEVILMPLEKKFSIIVFYLYMLRAIFGFKLASYNHPMMGSMHGRLRKFNLVTTKLLFRFYDIVVFYTEQSRDWALNHDLIDPAKAHFANNTLDTASIWAHHKFEINNKKPKTILFIGRLVKNKQIGQLFEYFLEIKKMLPDCRLKIIGDGPERPQVEEFTTQHEEVEWLGAIVEEPEISRHMEASHVIFVPGHSGLSIVHSFCYGKPYITTAFYLDHPPELAYLENNVNGLILDKDLAEGAKDIVKLLCNVDQYSDMCLAAFRTAENLSIELWESQMKLALQS